jgi:hypothetical protein
MPRTPRKNIRVKPELHEWLKIQSGLKNKTIEELTEEAIMRYRDNSLKY